MFNKTIKFIAAIYYGNSENQSVHDGLRLIPLRPDGSESKSRPLSNVTNGEYLFNLSEKDKTHWYILTK